MAPTISNVYVSTFENTVRHLAQQSASKLRGTVQERSTTGQDHNWETLDSTDAAPKTGVLVDTPVAEVPWGRRVSLAASYHAGEATEQEDPVQMLVDPNSNLAMALGMAMKRQIDDIILTAGLADALKGDGGTEAFPASQVVGNGTGEIDFNMVAEVQEKFMSNDIDPDVPKVFVVGPKQVHKLMLLTEQTSADYVHREALMRLSSTGIVPNWMGFTWINSTRIQAAATGVSCLAYTSRAIGLQVNRDISARIAEDPSKSFAWRIYCFMTMGAVRVEDKHIVHANVADTVTPPA